MNSCYICIVNWITTTLKLNRRYKTLTLIVAFAVIFVSLGSLINFHQHKIWGKQLIPQLVANNRVKDESKYFQSFAKKINQDNSPVKSFYGPAIITIHETHFQLVITENTCNYGHFFITPSNCSGSSGLRAPPLA